MARYRKIDVRIWSDAKIRQLSSPQPNAQSLWIYLLTNPDTTSLPGLFRAGEAGLAEALGWPLEGFREGFRELSSGGLAKADWKARLVFLPNVIRHNPPENPNVIKGWKTPWDELPECDLKVEAYQLFKEFLEGFAKGFQEAFRGALPEPYAKSGAGAGNKPMSTSSTCAPLAPEAPEVEEAPRPPAPAASEPVSPSPTPDAVQVFEAWKATMGHPKAKLDAKRARAIKARIADGYTVDDLKLAISGCAATPHNMGKNDRGEKFDDIELICRNSSQVDRFMANATARPVLKADRCPNDISQEAHNFFEQYAGCQIDFETSLPITDPLGNPLPYPGAPFELAKKASVS